MIRSVVLAFAAMVSLHAPAALAADIFVCAQSAYGGTFRFEFYRNGQLFDSTTVAFKDKLLRISSTVPEKGCGYSATVVPLDPRFGPSQTMPLYRPLRMKAPGACVNWWQMGWLGKNLGTAIFTVPNPEHWWQFSPNPTDDARWWNEHPWLQPAIFGAGLSMLLFIAVVMSIGGRLSRAEYERQWRDKYGEEAPKDGLEGLVQIVGSAAKHIADRAERENWTKRVKEALVWWKTERDSADLYARAHRDEILAREAAIREAYTDTTDPCFSMEGCRTVAEFALTNYAADIAYHLPEKDRTADHLTNILRAHHGRDMEELLPRAKRLLAEERTEGVHARSPEQDLEDLFAEDASQAAAVQKLMDRCAEDERRALAQGASPGEALMRKRECEARARDLAERFYRERKA